LTRPTVEMRDASQCICNSDMVVPLKILWKLYLPLRYNVDLNNFTISQ
jgi:hypothetical protein